LSLAGFWIVEPIVVIALCVASVPMAAVGVESVA